MDINKLLEKYRQGASSLEEEKSLRKAFDAKAIDEPMFAIRGKQMKAPASLQDAIQKKIEARKKAERRRFQIPVFISTGIAAAILLFFTFQIPQTEEIDPKPLQLSDNLKRERFEDAIRIIGDVLGEEKASQEKVIYEDNDIIISVEK